MTRDEECPHCGARFRAGRMACPECGSDAETGWRSAEEVDYQSIEIPDSWDEDAFGPSRRSRPWLVVAAVLALIAMVVFVFLFR